MNNKEYIFSFTAAGAAVSETIVVARCMCSLNDWSECKHFVLRNNLLQKTKTSTSKKQYAEIERRLKNLT